MLTYLNFGTTLNPSQRARWPVPVTSNQRMPLYTPEQRVIRDTSKWTLIQGILAPVQFLVFLISVALLSRYAWTGEGQQWAFESVVVKTLVLYTIMITGCIWEKVVFDQYLFAPAFFWEDIVSMVVMVLHTAYVFVWLSGSWSAQHQLYLAGFAYFTYAVNAAQYIYKLRTARLQTPAAIAAHNPPHPTHSLEKGIYS